MLDSIITHFSVPGTFVRSEPFGSGLINKTYLCEFLSDQGVRRYILQQINTSVFKNPEHVMENVEVVTRHIAGRMRAEGLVDLTALAVSIVSTRDGRALFHDDTGKYWRVYQFIEGGSVYDTVRNERQAYEVGRAIGRFQSLVSDLSPGRLHDTLPGFHHTPRYLTEFKRALSEDAYHRAKGIQDAVDLIMQREQLASMLMDEINAGRLPIRVVHNDPKVNNVLMSSSTDTALCMLDLDTVKSGIVHFDFGDCIRSVANPAGEDPKDVDDVHFDKDYFAAVTRGYIREVESFLTSHEIALLTVSVKIITFELSVRFLTDYLQGDSYFGIRYPEHNLYRAQVQFKLLREIERVEDWMADFVERIPRKR